MNWKLQSALGVGALLVAAQAAAQVTFYDREGFQGRSLSTDRPVRNLERQDFNEQASSAVVEAGRWQVCEDPQFEGRCVVLRPGSYDSLRAMGMNNRISSVRPLETDRSYGYQRTFQVPITSVRAVMGPQQERCWTERQPAYQSRSDDVGDAIAGAIIGRLGGERDVQHCERVASAPQHWEVTYNFRGTERSTQMNVRPSGGTLTVDESGNPIG